MPFGKNLFVIAALAALFGSHMATANAQTLSANEKLVKTALHAIFVQRDASAIDRYWGVPYLQHNPGIADGHEDLKEMIKAMPATFQWQPGFITEGGDIVMIHGRYIGWGPNPKVVTDIFRIKNGKIVEHWDTVQDEVPAAQTKSGRPMFSPGEGSH